MGVQGSAAASTGSNTSAHQQAAARRVTRMCLTIATTFSVAWLPYQLTRIVMVYGRLEHALLIVSAVRSLSYVNSCVNPVIYALMWRPFRLSLVQVAMICPGRAAEYCYERERQAERSPHERVDDGIDARVDVGQTLNCANNQQCVLPFRLSLIQVTMICPSRAAKYCYEGVRLSVCLSFLSFCTRLSQIPHTARPNRIEFSTCVLPACGRDSVLLCRCCKTLCTSGFEHSCSVRSNPL